MKRGHGWSTNIVHTFTLNVVAALFLLIMSSVANKFSSLNHQSFPWHSMMHFPCSNTNDFSLFYVFDTSPLKYHVVLLEMKKHLDFSSIISLRQMNLKTWFAVFLGSRRNTNISIWKWNQLFRHCWGLCSWKVS